MRRRPTIHELVWPKDSAFGAIIAWPRDFSTRVLARVWEGFDRLATDVLSQIPDGAELEHIERSLTDLHFDKIVELQTGEEPFLPTREVPDFESRCSRQAMPPSNDFGFKIRGGDLSLVWPLEAKVIGKPADVARYLKDLNDKYLACRSSPFSPEAALIGYMLDGDNGLTFGTIADRLGQELSVPAAFPDRSHRISEHQRTVPNGKPYPVKFRCHHLLMTVIAMASDSDQ